METIYNWLLKSMGNEGNFYTILNCQRGNMPEGPDYLRIMVRSKDFKVMNLVVYTGQPNEFPDLEPDQLSANAEPQRLTFSNQQQVLDYLATGETPEPPSPTDAGVIQVLVVEPNGESGQITFPPEQTTP
jgi:hypothetical protein